MCRAGAQAAPTHAVVGVFPGYRERASVTTNFSGKSRQSTGVPLAAFLHEAQLQPTGSPMLGSRVLREARPMERKEPPHGWAGASAARAPPPGAGRGPVRPALPGRPEGSGAGARRRWLQTWCRCCRASSGSRRGWCGCWAATRGPWPCRAPTPTWWAPGTGTDPAGGTGQGAAGDAALPRPGLGTVRCLRLGRPLPACSQIP